MMTTTRRISWLLPLVLLALLAGCDDSGLAPSDPSDGDGPTVCTTDQDCGPCKVCLDGSGGKLCRDLPCEENIDCADLGADSYCQFGVCICPSDEDGDAAPVDGDDPGIVIYTEPAVLNFGAVQMGGVQTRTLRSCNGGLKDLKLFSAYIFQDGISDPEEQEFHILGSNTPGAGNTITLASGECHEMPLSYEPRDPGKDSGLLLLNSEAGTREIPLQSEEKGKPNIAADCEPLDPDFAYPSEEWETACGFGFVPLGEKRVMPISILNLRGDAADNAVLVIEDITLQDPDDPENAFIKHYAIDHKTIEYADNEREIWLAPEGEEIFNLVYAPQAPGLHFLKILLFHNDQDPDVPNPFPIRVLGAGVIPELVVAPEEINFGNVEKGKCKTLMVEMTNRGGAILDILDVQLNDTSGIMSQVFGLNLDPDLDTEDNIPISLEKAQTGMVGLSCCPVGNESYINQLNIISNDRAQDRWLTRVPVSCTGVEAFCDVWPSQLAFGAVPVNTTETKTLRIGNNGRATARITEMDIVGSFNFAFSYSIDLPADIPPGGIYEVDIDYTPTSPGSDGGELVIVFREGDCQRSVIPLVGNGTQPNLVGPEDCIEWQNEQVPPQDLTPQQLANWFTYKPVTIRNEGNETLVISDVLLPATFANWFKLRLPNDSGRAQIPPGGAWAFQVAYTPPGFGGHGGVVVICSNASNVTGGDYSGMCPAGTTAHEICLAGTAIYPRLFVEPSAGQTVFTGVVVGQPPPAPALVTVSNLGVGPANISNVQMSTSSSSAITIVSLILKVGANQTNLLDNWPEGGVNLLPADSGQGGTLEISVQCNPSDAGTKERTLQIFHSDRALTKPGGVPGSEYPRYDFQVVCTSGTNLNPVAITKSPAGDPPGPYGTRSIAINKGQEIVLDGAASYDQDAGDYINSYAWTSSDPAKVTFTLPTTESITRARFDTIGTYTITLVVADKFGALSNPNYRDSQLVVTVSQAPRAIAYQCTTGLRSFETETGVSVCFDGRSSRDQENQAVSEYRWFMRKLGESDFNFSTASQANYTFTNPGDYVVTLKVVDRFGNISVSPPTNEATINVKVISDESLRIELTWTNRGDVALHYIHPNGSLNAFSDCHEGNPRPNWSSQGFGNPVFEQASTNGVSPEVISHDNPGNGPPSYRVGAVYTTPAQTCGYKKVCRTYNRDCDRCGCSCLICIGWPSSCCKTCERCQDEWACTTVPAQLTFKFFVNDSPYPTFVKTGNEVKVDQSGDVYLFDIQRLQGKWYF